MGAARVNAGTSRLPSPRRVASVLGTQRWTAIAVTGIFVLGLLFALRTAQQIVVPIVIAVLLNFLLSPVVRRLRKARISPPLGAAICVLSLVGSVGVLGAAMSLPAREWIAGAPAAVAKARDMVQSMRTRTEGLIGGGSVPVQQVAPTQTSSPQILSGEQFNGMLGKTTAFLTTSVMALFLAYLLLAQGDFFMTRLVGLLSNRSDKSRALAIGYEIEAQVSVYLVTVTLVNVGVAIVTGLLLLALGMPNAMLWGALAGVLNFLPFVGPVAGVGLIAIASLTTFSSWPQIVAPPLAYYIVHLLESNLVSPTVLGSRLALNPTVVFVSVGFWWFILGFTGALLAVPLTAAVRIVCDHIKALQPIGVFLGK